MNKGKTPTPTEFLTSIGVTPTMARHIRVTAKSGNKTYTLHELLRDYNLEVMKPLLKENINLYANGIVADKQLIKAGKKPVFNKLNTPI